MAASVVVVRAGRYSAEFDVTMTADGDTTVDIAHGMGTTPQSVTIHPRQPSFYVGTYTVGTIGATTVTINKVANAGSGNGSPALRVMVQLYHSLVQ